MGMGVHDEYWGKTVMPCSNKYDKPQLLLLYHLALGYMSLLYALYSRANIDCISACVDGPMNQAIKSQLEIIPGFVNLMLGRRSLEPGLFDMLYDHATNMRIMDRDAV
ncbi:hypothetical protein H103_03421 [Trichophyton rubrum CBS 288.86]|uniref:Uncharacterized protein n=2 Tax=Trichophyton TaxID=5550 RepID=A0A022W6C3_TRIRU|nr:hypothetical protein H100_03417 [Trichophyton rubrum MR850]EZF43047.1 hypothetical protein H102_03412 [Trichophyton rubrum CBS 100081]EZF53691.1 hypothetical protein H103_03421 [Trichophyton rubrum CBS 288.86]EZF64311.1 hypothetical protein H104_03406 [Trichophyton rubrum CBS 289.86]EZF74934.1 hypothetical protein H105_03433 [Trichophyton soudanense CBS 452.61]EZF85610.1 hypothetical protein H110_03418 [Trichophyton rubrum MR1448]EZG17896.1 hypothetical protein H107_03528 [Trichophyton rub